MDVMYVMNVVITCMLLLITSYWIKKPISFKRLVFSAGVSSLSIFLWPLGYSHYLESFTSHIMLAACIVVLAFGRQPFPLFLKMVTLFFAVSFTVGGFISTLSLYRQPVGALNEPDSSFPLNVGVVLLTLSIGTGVLLWLNHLQKRRNHQTSHIVDMEIELFNKKQHVRGLLDSGNLLKDPITNTPVIILELEAFKAVLPVQQYNELTLLAEGSIDQCSEETKHTYKLRFIPYQSVGTKEGLLAALRPDAARIKRANNWIKLESILIAVEKRRLSTNSDFQAIVPICDEWSEAS